MLESCEIWFIVCDTYIKNLKDLYEIFCISMKYDK